MSTLSIVMIVLAAFFLGVTAGVVWLARIFHKMFKGY